MLAGLGNRRASWSTGYGLWVPERSGHGVCDHIKRYFRWRHWMRFAGTVMTGVFPGLLSSRHMVALSLIGASLFTAACEQKGFSGVQAEWDRRKAQQFYVVAASSEAAVISALGKELAIRPADGFCLSRESIETSEKSAVALIGDCALEADVSTAKRSARGELKLPRALPGIITVSISGDPLSGNQGNFEPDDIEAFLQSAQGRSLIGRTQDGSKVKVRESRRDGDAVYVLVEDKNSGPIPVLSDTFWRAFMTVQDRLAVITINGFRARPLGVETMLDHLSHQVVAMQSANSGGLADTKRLIARSAPIDAERIASAETGGVAASAPRQTSLRDLQPTSIIVSTTGTDTAAPKPEVAVKKAEVKKAEVKKVEPRKPEATVAAPEPKITVKPSVTVPVRKASVPKAKPSSTRQTAKLRNPSAGGTSSGADATAPATAPVAPRRKKRS